MIRLVECPFNVAHLIEYSPTVTYLLVLVNCYSVGRRLSTVTRLIGLSSSVAEMGESESTVT